MPEIVKKLLRLLKEPSRIPRVFKNKLMQLYKEHLLKDEVAVAISKWRHDRGDNMLRLNYPLNSQSIVFDLGGYKGDFACAINQKYDCHVYIFEPVEDFYNKCKDRFRDNPKIQCFNYGLSDETGQAFISDNNDGSSVIMQNIVHSKKIKLKQFQEQFDSLNLKAIDLLKVNVEGSEFLILPHLLNTGLIKNIKYLQVQFHDFYPNAEVLRQKLRGALADTHIEMWNYPFVWESWALLSEKGLRKTAAKDNTTR